MKSLRLFSAVVLLSFALHVVPSYAQDGAAELLPKQIATLHPTTRTTLSLIRDTLGDDHLTPWLQAIALQESNGGLATVSSTGSYGIMQIQISTAIYVLRAHPSLVPVVGNHISWATASRTDVKRLLISDPVASIRIAHALLSDYLVISKGNLDRAVAAYNVGIGAVAHVHFTTFKYVKDVKKYLTNIVQPFNAVVETPQVPDNVVQVPVPSINTGE